MALVKCRKCQHQVSSEARLCPGCGTRVALADPARWRSAGARRLILWSLALTLAVSLVVLMVLNRKAGLAAAAEPQLRALASACATEWAHARQPRLMDPGSLHWDAAPAVPGTYQGRPAIFVAYRALNAYGAYTLQQAICEIDPGKGKILQVLE